MKVKFIDPVQHDAKQFMPGDVADLPNAAAKALIDCGAAEAGDSSKAKAEAQAEAEAKAKAEKAEAEAVAQAQAKADAEALAANKPML